MPPPLTLKLMIHRPERLARFLATCALLLGGCTGFFPAPTASPTAALPSETPTATIVWFPPTSTPTSRATPSVGPTQDLRPGIGALLFTDDFSDPGLWNTASSPSASAEIDANRLVLSLSGQGPMTILSLRAEPLLADFYLEVTASLGLCGPLDQYGLLLRAAPGGSHYRFALRCDGRVRLERVESSSSVPLMDWLVSGDAPTGAPGQVRLGVWAVGNEFRFFLNEHYSFSLRDPLFRSGTLGFFAASGSSAPVLVSFTELSAAALTYASPTPSQTPTRTPTPTRLP
jgi:hypothetical protein